jgi:malate:Na+ symporter
MVFPILNGTVRPSNQELETSLQQTGPSLWARAMRLELGVLPVPVFLCAAVIVVLAAYTGRLTADLIGGLAVMMVAGVVLDWAGRNVPLLRNIGGPAIFCLFVPAALVGYGLFQPQMLAAVTAAIKTDNLLYLYIASLVVGSILGIDHRVLGTGFLKMCVPFLAGTAMAIIVGLAAGALMGFELKHTFFYILTPILGGGIGEGILPLSIAYSQTLGTPQGDLVATMIPAALIGNVVAILSAGLLGWFGERHPRFSGKGRLVKLGEDVDLKPEPEEQDYDLKLMGAGLLIICTLFTLGGLVAPLTGISGPVMMIVITAALKLTRVMPERMELGCYQMYRFVAVNLTPAVLVGLGAIFISWNQLVASLSVGYFVVCAATVLALVSTAFVTGLLMRMYPVETAVVTVCHSGLGGTGDVAILSAANRMNLMPFSQMVTRLGGAGTVVVASLLMHHFG